MRRFGSSRWAGIVSVLLAVGAYAQEAPNDTAAGEIATPGAAGLTVFHPPSVGGLPNARKIVITAAQVSVAPSSLGFGVQALGTSSLPQPATLTNTGTEDLTITSLGISGGSSNDFESSHDCPLAPATLPAGGSCVVNVIFVPTAGGPRRSSVSITHNAPGSPHGVILTGVGTALSASPAPLDFPDQLVGSTSAPSTVTLTNLGTPEIHVWSTTIAGTDSGDFGHVNPCPVPPATLPGGGSCELIVTFTPTAVGARTALLLISHDGGGSPHGVSLTGTGKLNPLPTLIALSPSTVDAGSGDTTLAVTGTDFMPQSSVQLSGTPLLTTFESATQLTAVIPAALLTTPGAYPVTVVTPSPGGGTSNPVDLTVRTAVVVTVSPSSRTLAVNQTQQFTATVTGDPDPSVNWYVNDIPGGDLTAGTITATGIYTAPGAVPSPETVTVEAVSVADPTKSGTASVTIILPPSDNYPRPGAGSVLRTPPSLPLVPVQGSTVAVLDWTAKDAYGREEDVLAICHSLSPSGIPHIHAPNLAEAVGYPFLAIAGVLDLPYRLTNDERNTLRAYVEGGGTLFLWRLVDNGLLTRLGITARYDHWGPVTKLVTFDLLTGDPALAYIDHDVEVNWQMRYPDFTPTTGYDPGTASPLAWWDTGDAAILRSDQGLGRAYVFGWRLRHILTEAERQIVRGEEPPWTNALTVDADICRLLVRGAYEGWAGANVQVRQFAPEGKPAALILTHDVDARSSYDRTPEFAQLESARGLRATFLFTTSPYNTGWVGTLYNASGMLNIRQALNLGHDVAAHSLGHFPDFDDSSFGSGTETAANYMPRYSWDLNQTVGMSVIGELGVSRWLLESDFSITVEGFRSGYLLIPENFLEGLRQTGYRRDSTYAAGLTRGYFPFVLFEVNSGVVTTYPIVEYPMGLEDRHLTDETFTQILDAWESVIRANYNNNAPTVLNIHPVSTGPRREALVAILDRVADLNLWIGDWKTFAEFWEAQGVTCERWPGALAAGRRGQDGISQPRETIPLRGAPDRTRR